MVTDYTSSTQLLNKKKIAWREWFVSSTFRISILILLAVLTVMYIIQMSSVSTKGYVISDLERKEKKLEQDVRALQVQIAQNGSMESIQKRLTGMNMVAVSEIEYISSVGTAVARR